MRIVAMTNEGQLPMMKNMLNSALSAGYPMSLFHCYILGSQPSAEAYNTAGFKSITQRKLEVILHNMTLDPEVLWIDNDIVLFQSVLADIRRYPGNFVMQDDLWGACTGFFLVRATPVAISVLRETIATLRADPNPTHNDQHAFNHVVRKVRIGRLPVPVSLLPQDEYPNGKVYFQDKRTDKAKIVHCNYLTTTAEKVARLKDAGLWDESDTGFNQVHVYRLA
jgi:hypothetical protein